MNYLLIAHSEMPCRMFDVLATSVQDAQGDSSTRSNDLST